jgi:predicted phage terminase large subunit-like protein
VDAQQYTTADESRLLELLRWENGENLRSFIARTSPHLKPVRHLEPVLEVFERTRRECVRAVIALPPRHGKLIADSTPVLTPDGWRTHGDLDVGDWVFAPDGTPTRVIARKPDDWASVEVVFSDGAVIKVHPDHLWSVVDRSAGRVTKVLETKQLRELGLRDRSGRLRFMVPHTAPLAGVERWLPVEPYFLGLWLGDGSAEGSKITAHPVDAESHYAELRRRGHEIGAKWQHPTTGCMTFTVLKTEVVPLMQREKYIPDPYFTAPLHARRDLLRGLVDSDGHVEPGGRVRFVNTNPQLVRDVERMVWTLGYRASTTWQEPTTSSSGIVGRKRVATVQWTPHDGEQQACLRRKDIRVTGKRRMRAIVEIRDAVPERGHCIAVDHPDSLYLVGEQLVPTHNTVTALHGVAWRILRDPGLRHAYATYGASLSYTGSRAAKRIAVAAGVDLAKDSRAVADWRTTHDGGLLATGVGGPLTGKGITGIALVDDTLKNRKQAESARIREATWEWFTDVVWTRLEDDASCIAIGTMWHPDDLLCRLLKQGVGEDGVPFELIRLPAIADESDDILGREIGEPLWPEKYGLKKLADRRSMLGEYSFASLYQQSPRPRGTAVFGEPGRFELATFNWEGCRICVCADPAATAKTTSDHTAAFVLAMRGYGAETQGWLLGHLRGQWEIPDNPHQQTKGVVTRLRELQDKWGGVAIVVEAVAGFKAVPQMLRAIDPYIRIVEAPAIGDKFTRAQGAAAAWNSGRLMVPTDVPWAEGVITRMQAFTGNDDPEDDETDAVSHGWNAMFIPGEPEDRSGRSPNPFG